MTDDTTRAAEPVPLNVLDYEARAAERLAPGPFDFVAGGVDDEVSLRRNREAFEELLLAPRMLTGHAASATATTALGERLAAPLLVAPMGSQGLMHPDAEAAVVRACDELGLLSVLSSGSTLSLEEVATAARRPGWFQQYLFKDHGVGRSFAERALAAGYTAICITVDAGVASKRERNIRNGYALNFEPINYAGLDVGTQSWGGEAGAQSGMASLIDRGATWQDLERFCSSVPCPVVVKGVMRSEDAVLACEHGAGAVVVSNHGARQLDTTPAPIELLPEVVAAVQGRCEVYVDGGFRRGTDILKALALGARAVLVGRPVLWGLAVGGQQGVGDVLRILINELTTAMMMSGQPSAADVDPSLVVRSRRLTTLTKEA